MGTQWDGMGRDLLCIDTFRNSILSSSALLKQFDIDLYNMIANAHEDTYKDTVKSFVGIAAIQVGRIYRLSIDSYFSCFVHELLTTSL